MSLGPTLISRTDNREETIRKETFQVGNVPENQQETNSSAPLVTLLSGWVSGS